MEKTTFPNNQSYLIAFESGPNIGLAPDRWRFEYILTNASGARVHNQFSIDELHVFAGTPIDDGQLHDSTQP